MNPVQPASPGPPAEAGATTIPAAPASPSVLRILGAGRAGTALARAAQSAHLPVRISASRPPRALRLHLAQYAPRAEAVPADEISAPDGSGTRPLVVLMVPQEDLDTVDPDWVREAVLVDATNRWANEPLPDWLQAGLQAGLSSSEAVAGHFHGATVVKALNHISHWDLDTAGRAGGTGRRALGIAGDDGGAVESVADLVDRLGFDPVVLDSLAAGRVLEPGGPVFNQPLDAAALSRVIGVVRSEEGPQGRPGGWPVPTGRPGPTDEPVPTD